MHLSAIDSEATMTLFRMKMIFSEIKVLLWLSNVLEDNVAERTARALLQSCFNIKSFYHFLMNIHGRLDILSIQLF